MHQVAKVQSLVGLVTTEGGIEVRAGYDPGGGVTGSFWFTALVDGQLDLSQQTAEISVGTSSVNRGGGLYGKRPNFLLHRYLGNIGSVDDVYVKLDRKLQWQALKVPATNDGLAGGLYPWTQGRLLEWRRKVSMAYGVAKQQEVQLPVFRVIQGKDKSVPALTVAQRKRLTKERLFVDAVTVLASGEVLAIGRRHRLDPATKQNVPLAGFVTLLWTKDLRAASLFVNKAADLGSDLYDSKLHFLGGRSLAELRLAAGDQLMRFERDGWKRIEKLSKTSPPDLWFGKPLLYCTQESASGPSGKYFARYSATGPWRPIDDGARCLPDAFAMDKQGVVWCLNEGALYSSRKPERALQTITRADWKASRKKLGLSTSWHQ